MGMRFLPWGGVLAVLGLGAPLGAVPAAAAPDGGARIAVVSTASGDGELTHCGCKKKQLGGIFRRPTILAKTRGEVEDLLLVDGGNWAAVDKFEPWEKTRFIWDLMGRLGYEAVTPGDRELAWGRADLLALYAEHPEIKIVSANVTDKSGAPVWDPFTVVEKAGVRIAITGVTSSAAYDFNITRELQRSDDFAFRDSREALRDLVPRMREQADLVVVLMQELPADAEPIVKEIAGMDVVVVSHNPGYTYSPDRIDNTLVVRAGNRGQYISVLDLTLGADKAIADFTGESIPLDKPVADDPVMVADVEAFIADADAREKEALKAEALRNAARQVDAVETGKTGSGPN